MTNKKETKIKIKIITVTKEKTRGLATKKDKLILIRTPARGSLGR
jgi:hypothetical protein